MARGVDLTELVKDLRRQVTALEEDLRARSDEVESSRPRYATSTSKREAQCTAPGYGDGVYDFTTSRGTPAFSVTCTRI